MALLSQDRLTELPKTTSRFCTLSSLSPSCPKPQAASVLVTRWKIGGTGRKTETDPDHFLLMLRKDFQTQHRDVVLT